MADFTSYRRVRRPSINRKCEDGCGDYIGHDAVRTIAKRDVYPGTILTRWTCKECHRKHVRQLAEAAEREGVRKPWLHGEVAKALAALPSVREEDQKFYRCDF